MLARLGAARGRRGDSGFFARHGAVTGKAGIGMASIACTTEIAHRYRLQIADRVFQVGGRHLGRRALGLGMMFGLGRLFGLGGCGRRDLATSPGQLGLASGGARPRRMAYSATAAFFSVSLKLCPSG